MDEHDDPALMDWEMSPGRRGGHPGSAPITEMPRVPNAPASGMRGQPEPFWAGGSDSRHDLELGCAPGCPCGHGPEPTVGPSSPSGASSAYVPPPNTLIRAFAELIAGCDRTVQIGGNMVLNDAIGIPYARVRGEIAPAGGLWDATSYERVIRQHLGL